MFIRIKKIKDKEYAYLVENKWRKRKVKGSRQKVKGYLGKVFEYDKKYSKSFLEYHNIKDTSEYCKSKKKKKDIIKDLTIVSLSNYGFSDKEGVFENQELFFDEKGLSLINKKTGKSVVLKANEGFLCEHTIKRILNYKEKEDEEKGYRLAKYLIEAGLDVPRDIFIDLYQRF